MLQGIAELLPADANARSSALRNKALIHYIVRVTDAYIEKALKEKHPLAADLKRERSVLLGGKLACLPSMRGPVLHKWLMSREMVVPSTRRADDLLAIALKYLIDCKKKLLYNERRTQEILATS